MPIAQRLRRPRLARRRPPRPVPAVRAAPARASRSASTSAARPSPSRSCSRTCSATPAAASCARRTSRRSRPGGPAARARPRSRSCPARVMLQDFTGVPAVVDLAAMRDAMADARRRPGAGQPARAGRPRHRPLGPGRPLGRRRRVRVQRRARVRAQRRALPAAALGADRVPRPARRAARHRHRPPGQPRVPGARSSPTARTRAAGSPSRTRSSGTDSHTTMVNGLGVLGYGVGGIEAEAVLLGQPLYQPMPRIVGVRLHGELPRGSDRDRPRAGRSPRCCARTAWSARSSSSPATASPALSLADRATISQHVARVRRDGDAVPDRRRDARLPAADRPAGRAGRPRRALRQGAGPVARAGRRARVRRAARARPRDRRAVARRPAPAAGPGRAGGPAATTSGRPTRTTVGVAPQAGRGRRTRPRRSTTASVAIAAITSCTNTSNPTVMVGAGLLARNAVARGPARRRRPSRPRSRPARRPSPATSSGPACMRAARDARLRAGGLRLHDLHRQQRPARRAGRAGHRGQRARRRGRPVGQPQLRGPDPPAGAGGYLASPPLVVAFALAGRVDIDLTTEPLGIGERRHAGVAGRHLAAPGRGRATVIGGVDRPGAVPRRPTRSCSRATSAGARCRSRRATATPGTPPRPTSRSPPFFEGLTARAARR